jgi:hypothetical protein
VHRDPRDRERNALLAAPTTRSEAAQSGTDGKTNHSVQPQTGSKINAGFPSADFRGGDNPADHPGMSRAPQYDGPTTIEVVRPERTIVRDVDEVLPVVLSSAALLMTVGGYAFLLVASIRRRRPGH